MRKGGNRIEVIYNLCKNASTNRVNVGMLAETLGVSEATIRRDLQKMEDMHLLRRFYGGAVINKDIEYEPTMNAKHLTNMQMKSSISRYAASLIKDNDVVYLDAGTTTEKVVEHIRAKNILVFTQALSVVQALYERRINCYTFGGYLNFNTNIIIDSNAIERIKKYRFSIAFLGTNGINPLLGFTTTNEIEAMLKRQIISTTERPYILSDSSKFNVVSNIKFADINEAAIITEEQREDVDYSRYGKVIFTDTRPRKEEYGNK